MQEQHNPFTPPQTEVTAAVAPAPFYPRPKIWVSCLCWMAICFVSAAPSFYWGFGTIAREQVIAMLTGIMMFVAAYVFIDQSNWALWLRNVPGMRLTLRITYGIRIALSVLFPAGLVVDVFCGWMSIAIVTALGGGISMEAQTGPETSSFITCLAVTLVQGVILNIVLAGIALPIFGIIKFFTGRAKS
ncbi:MAG: hypothetical protein Aurels2KO_24460 [Aureliella sp.]